MRAAEFTTGIPFDLKESVAPGFDVFKASVRAKTPTGTVSTEVAIFAKSAQMAKQLLQAQFGSDAVISTVTKIS